MQNLSFKTLMGAAFALLLLNYAIAVWWSVEPDIIEADKSQPVVGYATTQALISTTQTLLDKPGGYLSNDKMPPSLFMDNMPAFEFGALEQIRDLALVMRKEFSRSQSQSSENNHLKVAQPKFNIDSKSWMFPSAEGEYQAGIKALKRYQEEIAAQNSQAQFYARADNLNEWLKEVQKRLGSLSGRLAASVGDNRINDDLAGDSAARQSTEAPSVVLNRTGWWKIDDVFFEARGSCWAIINFMKAIEHDFGPVLEKKNARASLQQIIKDLEATQEAMWSPMVLNGSGFGIMANHSLVMANYISRANAAIIDLTNLLEQG